MAEVLRDAADTAAATMSTEPDVGQEVGSRELSEDGEIESDPMVDGDGDGSGNYDDEQRKGNVKMTEEPTPAPAPVSPAFPQAMIGQCKPPSVSD